MTRAAAAPGLVVAAAIAAVAGAPSVAYVALLLAIPFAALSVLDGVTAAVAGHARHLRVGLRVVSLALILAAALTGMPGIALLGLAALAAQPLEAVAKRPRRVARRPALPADR